MKAKESVWSNLRIMNAEIILGFGGTSGAEQVRCKDKQEIYLYVSAKYFSL